MAMADDCEHCNLDQVVWRDLLPCAYKSCASVWNDLVHRQKTDVVGVLTRDDRILYIIGILLVGIALQMLITR